MVSSPFPLSPYGADQIGLCAASYRPSTGPASLTPSETRSLPCSSHNCSAGPSSATPARICAILPCGQPLLK